VTSAEARTELSIPSGKKVLNPWRDDLELYEAMTEKKRKNNIDNVPLIDWKT
jgi:hypothetical protein